MTAIATTGLRPHPGSVGLVATVRLVHPRSGGEFDADERSVPQWLRSGWVPAADRREAKPA